MANTLKISLIQSHIFWKDINKNLSHFEKLISHIKTTDIILFPEMFNTAFCPEAKHLVEKKDGNTISWMKKIANQKKCAVSGTLMVKENKKTYNRLVWISKKGEVLTYDKSHLFSLAKENKMLDKGKEKLIIEEQGWRICPLICYDLRFPVFSRNDSNYDLLIYLANWPTKRINAWDALLKARAIENQSYTIGVNRIGEDGNGVSFNGHSQAFDAFGEKIVSSIKDQEEILTCEINLEDLKLKRRQMNFLKDRDKFKLL